MNLARELAWTQFKLKYTGSALGYVWSLVKPLMMFGIMYAVFGVLLGASKQPAFAFQLLFGIVVWNFFGETTGIAMSSIASAGNLIRKAFFPRSILVVAATMTSSITLAINLVLVILIGIATSQISLGWQSLALPLFIVELYALVLGVSLLLASLFVFYRDLGHIWEVLSLVLFYASAVVFPVEIRGEKLARLIVLNPVAQIIEDVRHSVVTTAVPWTAELTGWWLYAVPLGLVLVAVGLGTVVFRRLTPRFAEEL